MVCGQIFGRFFFSITPHAQGPVRGAFLRLVAWDVCDGESLVPMQESGLGEAAGFLR